MATPYVTIVRNVVASTQDLAADELMAEGRSTLVVADSQTAGRGRSGSDWWQAPRATGASLAFSAGAIDVSDTFSLAVGMAVRAAIMEVLAVRVDLKWPNDLEIGGRKVGGILVETNEQRTVVGCGLNLYWPDPPGTAGALTGEDPGAGIGEQLARSWATQILETAGEWDRDGYLKACSTLGAEITWLPDGRGRAETVDDLGGLVVATASGHVTIRSGEVRMVRSL